MRLCLRFLAASALLPVCAMAQSQKPLDQGVPSTITDAQLQEVETRLGRRLQSTDKPNLQDVGVVVLKSGDKIVCGRISGIRARKAFPQPQPFIGMFFPPGNPITELFGVLGYTDKNREEDIRQVCKERGIALPAG
ncbi:hypothetical protein [Methylopila sp. M107]|uniref:hypothetical protein n=1 Tax=Methylopila sp. M107 TaxID=1101190 RepID=UPI0012DE6C44|nr:hypothetical protein [Methylopila sp. M107]